MNANPCLLLIGLRDGEAESGHKMPVYQDGLETHRPQAVLPRMRNHVGCAIAETRAGSMRQRGTCSTDAGCWRANQNVLSLAEMR